jgi:four helix bundle protein
MQPFTQVKSCLAAEGIATNVVEGCGAAGGPEFARLLDIATKSANETEHHPAIYPRSRARFTTETAEIRTMAYAYRSKAAENRREP